MCRNQISSFARNGSVHLNQPCGGRQFSRLLETEVCGISGNNAGYSVFRGGVKSIGYTMHSAVSTFTYPPVRHCVSSHFNWSLPFLLEEKRCIYGGENYLETLVVELCHTIFSMKKRA